jgi:MSHA pilin protein MshD
MSMNSRPQHRGFTLIELIIFIVVVSAGLAGILSVMNTVVKSSADPMVRKQAIAIAESLLEEILLKDYANPVGGDTGAVRALFDDVDQYAGYTTSGGVKDVLGTAVAGLERYDITSVAVGTTTLGSGAASQTVKRVEVTVTGPGGAVSLSGYRGNY